MLIKRKLPLMIIILISIPLILLSILIYRFTSDSLVKCSKENIYQITKAESTGLIELINEEKKEAELSAQKASVIELLEDRMKNNMSTYSTEALNMHKSLKERVNKLDEIQYSFIADVNGNIVSDSDGTGKILKINDRQYFMDALSGKLAISSTLRSKVDGKLIIAAAAPIRDENGNIIGVFGNCIKAEYFEKFISKLSIGDSGYAYIVDYQGQLVAHPDKNKIGTPVDNTKLLNIINTSKDSKNDAVQMSSYNYYGKDKYIGYSTIPEVNWTLAVVQDVDEINLPAMHELYLIIGVTIIMLLLAITISIISAKSITGPIEKLINTMNKAAQGDLTSICDHQSKDELGQLSSDFNIMIQKLNLSYEELSAVYEELSATEEELRAQYDELVESQEALTLSEERYKQALDGINDAVWEWDLRTNKFFASDKWYEITGYSIKDIDILNLIKMAVLPEFQETMLKDIRNHLNKKTSAYRSEFKIITASGEVKWILNRGKLLGNSKGESLKFSGSISDITITKSAEEKVRELAYYDPLTGIPNRTTFFYQLDEAIKSCRRNYKKGAVLFIDLDDFKKINDSLGHDVGDMLLKAISNKLIKLADGKDAICRFGGDEFLILRKDVVDKMEIIQLAKGLLKIFETSFDLAGKQIFITGSIGISIFPDDGLDKSIILKNADTAMYKAKEKGKNMYQFYNAEMSKGLMRNMIIEKALRTAIPNNELYLQYQPQVEIKTGRIVGNEALVRLKNDELGFVSPGEFIPVSEKTGLIIPIGEWVMKIACWQNMKWMNKGYDSRRISINVSSRQIQQLDFVEKVKNYISELGIPPQLVEIEITESILMESLESNVEILNELRKFGVRIALDDFGTGYSSLNYLRTIPIDTLKIDKSFIDDICFNETQGAIVDGIIQMAHKMGIEVVAEGIETRDQLEVLRQKGCDIVQGYIFSKPLHANELDIMLGNGIFNM
ncbi:MAG: EAL domain-containing protein [Bacillota bacterium]|nr:EAL domain-containing protein [Bacillota bacterium]